MATSTWLKRGLVGLAAAAWLSTSVWTVQQDQTGLVHRFGAVARTVGPGFHLTLPWPVESIQKLNTGTSRSMPIGFTYLEQLGAEGMDPTRREWLTGDTNIVKIEATLYYSITDPVRYAYGMSELADGLSRDMVLRRLTEAVMTERISQMTVDDVLASGKTQLRLDVMKEVQAQATALDLGVTLTAFNMTEVAPPLQAEPAFNEVTSAKSYRDQQKHDAEGARETALSFARSEADRIVQLAQSEQAKIVGEARGWAQSFHALSESLQSNRATGMQRLWLQSISSMLSKASTQVLPRVAEGQSTPFYVQPGK